MMKNITAGFLGAVRGWLVAALVMLNFSLPAHAQFVTQGQVVTSAGGSANAQTGTVANATTYSDLLNVVLIFVPAANNSGDTTLAISGLGGALPGGAVHFRKGNGAGVTALVGGELVIGQPELIEFDGTYFQLLGPVVLPVGIGNQLNSTLSFGAPPNLQITPTVGSNQLTISICTPGVSATACGSNNNASATNPIPVAFRDVTIANGDPVIVSLQAALSFAIGSGNTMGCQSGVMCRIRIYLGNNAGTMVLCGYNSNSGTSIVGLNEQNLQTSNGSTSGGSSAQVLYCNAAISGKAVREIGYIDVQETTAGTWASVPTYTQLMGPGVRKAGDVLQDIFVSSTTPTTIASMSNTVTVPSVSITPTSAANLIRASAYGTQENAGSNNPQWQIFRAPGASSGCTTAVGSTSGISQTNGDFTPVPLFGLDAPNSNSQQTYVVCGKGLANTGNIVWCASGSPLSSTQTCVIEVQEIMSRLEPANDNDEPLRMVG